MNKYNICVISNNKEPVNTIAKKVLRSTSISPVIHENQLYSTFFFLAQVKTNV